MDGSEKCFVVTRTTAKEKYQLLETMNITPTESEAWDIVQMEEIERELMDDDNPLFNDHGDKE